MSNVSHIALGPICERILEQMAFAIPDEVQAEPYEFGKHVRIRYEGLNEEGEVVVSASDGFLTEFVSGMLGVEPEEITDGDCTSALRELANVICGEVIRALGGGDRRIRLGLPEDRSDPCEQSFSAEDLSHIIVVDGEPFRALVFHHEL